MSVLRFEPQADRLPKEYIPGIDALKVLLALMILFIHFPVTYSGHLNFVIRAAVPAFFIISGYFLVRRDGTLSASHCVKVFIRILLITFWANLFFWCYLHVMSFWGLETPVEISTDKFIDLLLYGDVVSSHFWYLTAYLYALLIIIVTVSLKIERILVALIPVLLFVGVMFGKYGSLFQLPDWFFDNQLRFTRNGLTIGLPCVMLGVLLARNRAKLFSPFLMAVLLVVVATMAYAETAMLPAYGSGRTGDVYIMTIPLAFVLVCMALQIKESTGVGRLARFGQYTLLIYIVHPACTPVFELLPPRFLGYFAPFVIFAVASAVSVIFVCGMKIFRKKLINLKIISNFAQFFHTLRPMGKFTEFKLPLKSMPEGTHEFEYRLGKQFFVNMENNDIRNADLTVKLTAIHKNDCYDLSFAVTGGVVVACDRCLDDLELPVETSYHIVVKYGEDYCDDNDDFLIIPEGDTYLNVAYIIHDTVALALPIKHVHPLGRCNRAMSALLKKHRAVDANTDTEDVPMEADLIDEPEDADSTVESQSDPRWDKLKGFDPENN